MSDVQLEQVYMEMYEKPLAAGLSKNQLQLDCQAAVTEKFGDGSPQANWMNTRNKDLKLAVDTLINAEEIIGDFYKPSNMRSPVWIRRAIESLLKNAQDM